jgi:hypothetical protein
MASGAYEPEKSPALQITHRASHLPGCREALQQIPSLTLIQLSPGAAARGALQMGNRFAGERKGHGVTLVSSRPWLAEAAGEHMASSPGHDVLRPTHILHGHYAHPITTFPLIIGLDDREAGAPLLISGNPADVPHRCCMIKREDNQVVLVNGWPAGTLVNARVVLESCVLMPGQTVRVGARTDELTLIVCVDADEKEKRNLI